MKKFKHAIFTVLAIHLINLAAVCECVRNNACKTFEDYRTIEGNPNCWYNPDVESSPEEIAKRYGFPFEIHQVTTQDGYIISLFRIPHNGSDINRKKPVAFFQHGIAADALTWMTAGLNSSVFVFANHGYDVWISNLRGTEYSSKHVRYTVYDREYWLFSFHEMALYDVPAILDYVTQETQQTGHITYIGHSMGSTIALIYTSLMPQHAKTSLKTVLALAPVAYMDHVGALTRALVPYRYLIWEIFSSLGIYGLGTNIKFKIDLVKNLCSNYPFISLCATASALIAGTNPNEAQPSSFAVGIRSFPLGMSVKTLFHFAQILATKRRFQFFDYGPDLNRKLYNASWPPEYPLSQIKIPMHLFYGKRDLLATEKDVFYLYDKLETEKSIMEAFNFAHLDFLSAVHSGEFYRMLLKYA